MIKYYNLFLIYKFYKLIPCNQVETYFRRKLLKHEVFQQLWTSNVFYKHLYFYML